MELWCSTSKKMRASWTALLALVLILSWAGKLAAQELQNPPRCPRTVVDRPEGRGLNKFWKPDPQEIRELEQVLPEVFRTYVAKNDLVVNWPFDNYSLRYAGIFRNGKRIIEVSGRCGCRVIPDDWDVYDGGSCYFEAGYDPVRKEVIYFTFHSSA
jgi:hypothetical protein